MRRSTKKVEETESKIEYGARVIASTLESDAIRNYLLHCGKHLLEKVEVDWPTGDGNTRKVTLNRYIDLAEKPGPAPFSQCKTLFYLAGRAVSGPGDAMELRNCCLLSELPGKPVVLEAIAGQMESALAKGLPRILEAGTYSILTDLKARIDSFAATLKNQLHHAEKASDYLYGVEMRENYPRQ